MIRRLHQNSGRAAISRVCDAHRKWVRGHACSVPGCDNRRIEAAHVRVGTDGGTGLKPSDRFVIPLCGEHHAHQHNISEQRFEQLYRINMADIAAELARKSPHLPKLTGVEE